MIEKLTHSLIAKIVATFLITIVFFADLFMVGSVALVYVMGGYEGTAEYAKSEIAESFLHSYAGDIGTVYLSGRDPFERYEDANFWFEIHDEKGNLIRSNYKGGKYIARIETDVVYALEEVEKDGEYYLTRRYMPATLYAKEQPTRTDHLSNAYWVIETAFKLQWMFVALAVIGVVLFFALLVFLLCSAGHRKGEDKPRLNRFDKIPFDVLSAAYFFAACMEVWILGALYGRSVFLVVALAVFVFADFLLGLLYLYTFAARIKTGTLIKGTVLYIACSAIYRFVKRIVKTIGYILRRIPLIWKTIGYILRRIPLIWKTAVAVAVITVLEYTGIVLFHYQSTEMQVLVWFVSRIILIPTVLLIALAFKKLQSASKKIAEGNIDCKINTDGMLFDFKQFGENLNNINIGMKKAVSEQMKSERFKTELITNVSHDIKTPLTSIINYVDLIKKEECENETIKEYTEVLDRQSSRLKKLIDDLVEASKVSTGAIAVDLKPCQIGVLLSQTAGEYEEKLKNANLDIVLTQPEDPVVIMADGRHLWRIFDNLMNNICKYSLPSSRVYLTLDERDGTAVVTFKNISKISLNISSDELMERFVRGDSSRNTEGSGLGLSIAKSLTELQQGGFDLMVDGDLFKVTLTFKTIV